jgi:hypothetical protein
LKQKCVKDNLDDQESKKSDKKGSDEPQIPETRYPAAISTVGTDILTLPGKGIHFCLIEILFHWSNIFCDSVSFTIISRPFSLSI